MISPQHSGHDLNRLQSEHYTWMLHNFPDSRAWEFLLGLQEELGELSHAYLKLQQGIRGGEEVHVEEMKDAVGDIVVYLAGFCNAAALSFADCVENTWREVKQRDWRAYPETGRP